MIEAILGLGEAFLFFALIMFIIKIFGSLINRDK